MHLHRIYHFFFFFNDTATTEIYTLSLHDALPISAPEMDLSIHDAHHPSPSWSSPASDRATEAYRGSVGRGVSIEHRQAFARKLDGARCPRHGWARPRRRGLRWRSLPCGPQEGAIK